ncbi:hypothetical protein ACOMHN_054950 [Nucella lapillus]
MPELAVMSPSRLRSKTRKSASVSGYNSDTKGSFWGVELTEESPEVDWNMREDDDEETGPDRDYMVNELLVKMATLGQGLTKDQEQIVEVETTDADEKMIKIPVINMVAGKNSMVNLDLEFFDRYKVTFRLISGSGPVYLSGCVFREHPEEEEDSQDESLCTDAESTATDSEGIDEEIGEEEEEEEEEDEDEDVEEEEVTIKSKGLKRKTPSPSSKGSKSKRIKMERKESEEEETEEEKEEDEEDMDTGAKKKKRSDSVSFPGPKQGKSPKVKADKKSPLGGMKHVSIPANKLEGHLGSVCPRVKRKGAEGIGVAGQPGGLAEGIGEGRGDKKKGKKSKGK